MRTEVKISFHGTEFPGGAHAALSAAGCGTDVATVRERSWQEGVVSIFVDVTLDATDARLRTLLELLVKHGVSWLEVRQDHYTDEECERARLVVMNVRPNDAVFGGPRMGTRYDLKNACMACGAGVRQTSALMIDGKDLHLLEGRRAASTYYSDILVDNRLAEDLEALGAWGLSFRSAYAVMKDKRQMKLPYRQMCAARALPPISPRSTGFERRDGCRSCTRSGIFMKMDDPLRLTYRAKDVAEIDDVMTTWEWFNDFEFDGDVSNALFPYPLFLVTPKVMRVIRAAGNVPFDWLPIRVVDDNV